MGRARDGGGGGVTLRWRAAHPRATLTEIEAALALLTGDGAELSPAPPALTRRHSNNSG